MGTYVCQAFNDVGFAESMGKLQVIGKYCRNSLEVFDSIIDLELIFCLHLNLL